jgi:hypothetical protein
MRDALEGAAVRVAPSMNAQDVANIVWGLATLGWQAGEGPMRGALEGAAVRVAPTMKPQEVANIIWGLATLASELSKSCEKRLILPNVAYFVVFAKSPPFFFLGGPF